MGKGVFQVPQAINEPIKSYAPGTPERTEVLETYKKLWHSEIEVPLYIGSEEIKTGDTAPMNPPHDHKHQLGVYHQASKKDIEKSIEVALEARKKWADLAWEQRAAV